MKYKLQYENIKNRKRLQMQDKEASSINFKTWRVADRTLESCIKYFRNNRFLKKFQESEGNKHVLHFSRGESRF